MDTFTAAVSKCCGGRRGLSAGFVLTCVLFASPSVWAAAETISCNAGGSRTLTVGTYTDADGSQFSSGADLTLNVGTGSNCTFTITLTQADSPISLASLTIQSGVTLTHALTGTTLATYNKLAFTLSGNFDLQSGGVIDVSTLGYNGTNSTGYTNGNTTTGGSQGGGNYGVGGSHGGRGGYRAAGQTAVSYDSITNPTLPGGGGGGYSGYAGSHGGGVVRITVGGDAVVAGNIIANAGDSTYRGGGAGGTIYLNVTGAISGGGDITANGGAATYSSSTGGGGGRIALIYDTSSLSGGTISAYGGSSDSNTYYGAAGTIYTEATADTNGHLTIDNKDSTYTNPYYATNIDSAIDQTFDSVTITNYGRLWIESSATSFVPGILQIDSNSFFESDINLSFTDLSTTKLYLNGGTAQFDGTLTLSNSFSTSGSVTGILRTNSTTTVTSGAVTIGTGLTWDALGAVEKSSGVDLDSLSVTGALVMGENALSVTNNVTVNNGGTLTHQTYTTDADYTPAVNITAGGDFTLASGGAIDVEEKGYLGGYRYADSYYASGISTTGSYNNTTTGRTYDVAGPTANTTTNGSTYTSLVGAGGSHGGRGGLAAAYTVALEYDSLTNPTLPGGGGATNGTGNRAGTGGGVVRITADNIIVNDTGYISADGGDGQTTSEKGAGAGGTVNLTATTTISGDGTIRADGGLGDWSTCSSGGGGRVAMNATNITHSGTVSAYGDPSDGTANSGGSAGTVFKKASGSDTNGHLTIANNNNTVAYYATNIDADLDMAFDSTTVTTRGKLWIESTATAYSSTTLQVDSNSYFESDIALTFTSVDTTSFYPNGGIVQFDAALNLTNFDTTSGDETGTLRTNGTISVSSGAVTIGTGLTWDLLGAAQKSAGVNLDTLSITGSLVMGETALTTSGNVTVNSGGTVTHKIYRTDADFTPQVNITSGGDFTVSSGGTVDVEDKGYLGGYRTADAYYVNGIYTTTNTYNNSKIGRTYDVAGSTANTTTNGSSYISLAGAGGSHGGRGGYGAAYNVAVEYDSITNPTLPGGGGGTNTSGSSAAGMGGGVIRITAVNIVVGDTISADGGDAITNYKGGGGGGTVYLNASTAISGSGTIRADGGFASYSSSSGGGGGRIAIISPSITHNGTVSAYGDPSDGTANADGAAGTVWKHDTDNTYGDLSIVNCATCSQAYYTTSPLTTILADDQTAAYNDGYVFNSLTFSQYGILNIPAAIDSDPNGGTNPNRKFFCKSCPADNDTASDGEVVYDNALVSDGMTDDYTCVGTRTIQFTFASSNGDEGTTPVNLQLTLSLSSSQNVTVNYAAGGTATGGGTDYSLSGGVATVTAGQTTTDIPITINNDGMDEDDETIVMTISSPSGAELGTNTQHTYTINDNDNPPTISINDVAVNETESNVTAAFTVSLNTASGKTVTVDYATANGTALAGSDYTSISTTQLTFTAGQASKPVNVTVLGDTLDEDNETFNVNLSSPSNATFGDNQGVGTINDNDAAPTVTLGISNTPLAENGGVATVTATLSTQSGKDATIGLAFSVSGTATLTSDYTRSGTSISITAGNTTSNITITGVDDSLDENDETVIVDLDTCTNCTESGTQQVTATITDDDAPPTVTLGITGTPLDENGGVATVTATLSIQSGKNATIGLAFSGTATNATDYNRSGASIAIAAGNPNGTVTITGVDDAIDEDAETIVVDIDSASTSNATESGTQQVSAMITDDDTAGVTVEESGNRTDITEGSTTDTYTFVLNSEPLNDVVLGVATDSQTTVNPTSLTFTSLNWNAAQTVTVTAVDDEVAEGNHTEELTHSAASTDAKYSGMNVSSVTANIVDNDSAGVSITQTGNVTTVTEGDATDTYTIVLTSEPTDDVTIQLSSDSPSYGVTVSPSQLTFTTASWNTPQTVTVTAADDDRAEDNHTATLTHTAASNDSNYDGIGVADIQVAITDDDSAGVTITASDGSTLVTEDGTTDTYTVVLTSEPTLAVTINVSTDNKVSVDPKTLIFGPTDWDTLQTVTITATDDSDVEGDHASTITHSVTSTDSKYNGIKISSLTVSITDDDEEDEEYTEAIAHAGGDQTIIAGRSIYLNASGSLGADLTYYWEIVSGEGSLADETTAHPTFSVDSGVNSQEVVVQLTVTDADGSSSTDTMSIHVVRQAEVKGKTLKRPIVGVVGEDVIYERPAIDDAGSDRISIQIGNVIILLPEDTVSYNFTVTRTKRLIIRVQLPDDKGRVYFSRIPVTAMSGAIDLGLFASGQTSTSALTSELTVADSPQALVSLASDATTYFDAIEGSQGDELGAYIVERDDEIFVAAPGAGRHGVIYIYDSDNDIIGAIFGSEDYPVSSLLVSDYLATDESDVFFGPDNAAMNENLQMGGLVVDSKTLWGFLLGGTNDFEGSIDLENVEVDARLGEGASYQSAAFGDLNGDGQSDLALATDDGQVLVYFGALALESNVLAEDADVTVTGGRSADCFGQMTAIGDVTGDGIGDLVIGAPCYGNSSGAVYAVFGSEEWESSLDVTSAANVVLVSGPSSGDGIGGDLLLIDEDSNGAKEIYTVKDSEDVYRIDLYQSMVVPEAEGPDRMLGGGGCSLIRSPPQKSLTITFLGLFLVLLSLALLRGFLFIWVRH